MGTSYSTLCAATNFLSNNPQEMATESTDFDEVGVIPRVLKDLFRTIDEEQRANKDAKFEVKVSFVEVYNEEFRSYMTILEDYLRSEFYYYQIIKKKFVKSFNS